MNKSSDKILDVLIYVTEDLNVESGITLNVAGSIISGTLISTYLHKSAKQCILR
jgi:hypothetical protein